MRLRWQRKAPRTRSDRTQVQSQIKSRCHRSSLKRRDSTAYPTSVQINGATALLLQADMDWDKYDKWYCSFSLCGGRRASMKFSSFHMMSISTSCSSHVSFERSSHTWTKFIQIQTQCNLLNGKNCRSHTSFSVSSRINSLCCCKAETGWDKWL